MSSCIPPSSRLPRQRWQIAPAQVNLAAHLSSALALPPLLTQVLLNRGIDSLEAAQVFLNPELQQLPSPLAEFPDLPIALELLLCAIGNREPIAICGDYDADGMTSTALLLRALRQLGAAVDYAIPSRMQEGYGINQRIVEDFYQEGVRVILTVDNGIAAYEPIAYARELGLTVIVTDHHDLPPVLPPAHAILNPKLIESDSPYASVAGVGVAYVLAICLSQCLNKTQDLTAPLLELFTLGTIADLAPLTGVNRRWVRRGLKLLPQSKITGVQALIQVAGLGSDKTLKPEAIGFRLGPRINAIGRLSDPAIIIELLTTEAEGRALELAMQCEQVNQLRQRLCELIEQEAIAAIESELGQREMNWQRDRVLVVVQPGWHHGVIGIVASRLVERYGVPVFIGTYEHPETDEAEADAGLDAADPTTLVARGVEAKIRGSARGIPEFNVFEALEFCKDLLDKHGGHRAAGGFTFQAAQLPAVRSRLSLYANGQLQPQHLQPLVLVDRQADFSDITLDLLNQLDELHPCGMGNAEPVFWTPNVRVLEQQTIGRDQSHLKLTLAQATAAQPAVDFSLKAIAWRWGHYHPLPSPIDVAYRLRLNEWNGYRSVQLELVGIRLAASPGSNPAGPTSPSTVAAVPAWIQVNRSLLNEPDASANPEAELDLSRSRLHSPGPSAHWGEAASRPALGDRDSSNGDSSNLELDDRELGDRELPHSSASNPDGLPPEDSAEAIEPIASRMTWHTAEAKSAYLTRPAAQLVSEMPPDLAKATEPIEFWLNDRKYACWLHGAGFDRTLQICNAEGQRLTIWPQQRCGCLGLDPSAPVQFDPALSIDITQPHYYHLIRTALGHLDRSELQPSPTPLDLTDSRNLGSRNLDFSDLDFSDPDSSDPDSSDPDSRDAQLTRQAEQIAEQAAQIAALNQQISQLQQQLAEVQQRLIATSASANDRSSARPTAAKAQALPQTKIATPPIAPADPKLYLKQKLAVGWDSLSAQSQKDLVAAQKNWWKLEALLQELSEDEIHTTDCSEAALQWIAIAEREVVQVFFKQIYQYLQASGQSLEINGTSLKARKKYPIELLPPLLCEQCEAFDDEALHQPDAGDRIPYDTVIFTSVPADDRQQVAQFLQQWQHPVSRWLRTELAASLLFQLDQFQTLAQQPDYCLKIWQLDAIRSRVLGEANQPGLLLGLLSC